MKELDTKQTTLAPDIQFKGIVSFQRVLEIQGELKGDISSENGILIIAPNARFQGKATVATIENHGTIKGTLQTTKNFVLHKQGHFVGDVSSPNIHMESGSVLHGQCNMLEAPNLTVKPEISHEM